MLRMIFAGTWTAVTPTAALRWLVLLPLFAAVFNASVGRLLERRGAAGRVVIASVGVGSVVAAAALAWWVVLGTLAPLPEARRALLDELGPFFTLSSVRVAWAFLLDPLAAVMCLVITTVGALIHLFAAGYMHDEPAYGRFFALLNGFVAAMLVLVLGDGFVTLFMGWEGVGLCSALLIGFWWQQPANGRAANKAFVVNRIGDTGLLFAMALLFWSLGGDFTRGAGGASGAGLSYQGSGRLGVALADPAHPQDVDASQPRQLGPTFSFREIEDTLALRNFAHGAASGNPLGHRLLEKRLFGLPVLWLVCLGLFVGACGKSAQLPLAVWLPDAMAGPTPVSALIHAATMVTAGVYLLARTHALFALVPAFGLVIAVVAAATALLAALAAMVQHDLKRVLAFSTISQLGFMFLAVGAGAPAVALFHVVTHACFKACLFLAAGAVIHALGELGAPPPIDRMLDFRRGFDARNPQDMRNMGGLGKRLPVVRAAYFAACWAIAGLPLGAGFFSKDAILEAIVASPALGQAGPFLALAALVTAGLTAFYMFRSYYLVFAGRPRPRAEVHHLHRPTGAMTAVLIVLGLASLGAGALLGWPEALRLDAHPRPPLLLGWLSHLASAAHGEAVESPAARRLALDLMGLGLISAVGGWYVARMLFKDEHRSRPFRERLANRLDGWHARAFAFFRLDALYDVAVVAPTLAFSRAAARFDAGVVDGLVRVTARAGTLLAEAGAAVDRWIVDGAVNGVAALLSRAGQRLSRVQSGRLGDYLRTTLLGLLLAGLAVAGAFWMTR